MSFVLIICCFLILNKHISSLLSSQMAHLNMSNWKWSDVKGLFVRQTPVFLFPSAFFYVCFTIKMWKKLWGKCPNPPVFWSYCIVFKAPFIPKVVVSGFVCYFLTSISFWIPLFYLFIFNFLYGGTTVKRQIRGGFTTDKGPKLKCSLSKTKMCFTQWSELSKRTKMSELSGFSKGYSMTKKQNVKVLIWDLEELPPVERDRGGAWRRRGPDQNTSLYWCPNS